jgi:hypothetical protein
MQQILYSSRGSTMLWWFMPSRAQLSRSKCRRSSTVCRQAVLGLSATYPTAFSFDVESAEERSHPASLASSHQTFHK